ncbi:MAG: HAD family phosphatase [Geobacteraceae bacterium]|nr:HAD family phosphatase [Geobacteraceae bacterium]
MLKAVIFDFDGIIVDSEPLHYKAFQRVLEPLGASFSWDDYIETYMGFDDRDAFREAFARAGKTLDDARLHELIAQKAELFQHVAADGVTAYPGVCELIRAISGNLPLAICSGALRSDIVPILATLGLTGCFDCMVTADDVPQSKPDPASYLEAVKRLQFCFPEKMILAENAVAIEDTPAGISSAKGAGLKVVAVTNSYAATELTTADAVVITLAELGIEGLCSLIQ